MPDAVLETNGVEEGVPPAAPEPEPELLLLPDDGAAVTPSPRFRASESDSPVTPSRFRVSESVLPVGDDGPALLTPRPASVPEEEAVQS